MEIFEKGIHTVLISHNHRVKAIKIGITLSYIPKLEVLQSD